MRLTLALSLIALALLPAGCDRDPAPGNQAQPADAPAEVPEPAASPVPSPTQSPAPAASAPPGGGTPAAIIPQTFLGSWDRDAAACTAPTSEFRLVISSDRLRFYETVAEVTSVAPIDRGVRLNARASGEGMTFDVEYRLRLDRDDRLDLATNGSNVQRVRCR